MKDYDKIKEVLRESKKPIDQEEIANKLGVDFWKVRDITNEMERSGLIREVR